jgi:hypothetical protein
MHKPTLALGIFLCVSAAAASAQTVQQCQSIERAGDMLACVSGSPPPVEQPTRTKRSHAAEKPAASVPEYNTAKARTLPDDKAPYDLLETENSKLSAKMKTLCRGC